MPKMKDRLPIEKRMDAETQMQERLSRNEITIGQAIREIRQRWLGLTQTEYARIVGISKNTLGAIERDEDTVTLASLDKVLKPLGYRSTIWPTRPKNTTDT